MSELDERHSLLPTWRCRSISFPLGLAIKSAPAGVLWGALSPLAKETRHCAGDRKDGPSQWEDVQTSWGWQSTAFRDLEELRVPGAGGTRG